MGKRRLVVVTVMVLVLFSVGVGGLRYAAIGEESFPPGPGNYRVRLVVRGQSLGDVKLVMACPLDMGRQHIHGESFSSEQLTDKMVEARFADRRNSHWTPRLGFTTGRCEARYEFHCTVDVARPNGAMKRLHKLLYAPPRPGEYLHTDPGIDPGAAEIQGTALNWTVDLERTSDQTRALFQFVRDELQDEPGKGTSPRSSSECLASGCGNALARSRLLAALLRNRGIPARLVHGLALKKAVDRNPHVWVEAWVEDHWLSLCPSFNHFGKAPPSYLILGHGDLPLVRTQNLTDVEQEITIEHLPTQAARSGATESSLARFFHRLSLHNLPPAEHRLVEFLLMLPLAALIICAFRNIVGMQSFGTFTPALLGMAFRELETLPGILVFATILLIGWSLRRILDRYHLLQVPRTSVMLTLVVVLLVGLIVLANDVNIAATRFLSLFPLVILTGMIERFWTLETEDGMWTSFKTLLSTLAMAAAITLVLSWKPLVHFLVAFPECVALILALQIGIGRYTGYRLSEAWRFRDLVDPPAGAILPMETPLRRAA